MSFAIKAEKLSKEYFIGYKNSKSDTFVQSLTGLFRRSDGNKNKSFWALSNVSFELEHGSILGIIGRNGAGKSTLLKILSRITPPTAGRVEINGRVASLLEVGTGFHPQLSGRENIYMNGTLLGMKKREVEQKLDEIVAFAEIGDFLDMPIKHYSSGMKVRLAFSVAAHLEAEILIVDEVLTVGDSAFQQKCLGKMNEVAKSGKTILLVSHNMSAIKNLCHRAIFLRGGMIVKDGDSDEIIRNYLNENLSDKPILDAEEIQCSAEHKFTLSIPTFSLNRVAIKGLKGEYQKEFLSDEEIEIEIEIEIFRDIKDIQVIVSLVDNDNQTILSSELSIDKAFEKITKQGIYNATCIIPANLLGQNQYFISVFIVNPSIEHLILSKGLSFNVTFRKEDSIYIGKLAQAWIRPQLKWSFSEKKKTEIGSINIAKIQYNSGKALFA